MFYYGIRLFFFPVVVSAYSRSLKWSCWMFFFQMSIIKNVDQRFKKPRKTALHWSHGEKVTSLFLQLSSDNFLLLYLLQFYFIFFKYKVIQIDVGELKDWFYLTSHIGHISEQDKIFLKRIIEEMCTASFHQLRKS